MLFYLISYKTKLMNSIKGNKTILFFILIFTSCLIVTSCEKKIKEQKSITNTKIEAQVLIELAESNLKVVAVTQKAQERKMESNSRTVFEKIESDHIKLKNKIKKIAKDNFIIIPNTLYDTKPLKDFISETNTLMYLKRTAELLITELNYYKTIATTTKNNDLKTLATEGITNIQKNIYIIKKELKLQE